MHVAILSLAFFRKTFIRGRARRPHTPSTSSLIMTDYETVARNERARLDASIPLNLRLSPDFVANLPRDVSEVPETCGLLTEEQIRITRMDGTALAQEIASGKVTAVDAVTAVASRAAIAEQLVRQLRLIDTLRVDRTEPVLRYRSISHRSSTEVHHDCPSRRQATLRGSARLLTYLFTSPFAF